MRVLVFGYSDDPSRFSYKASKLLNDFNHDVTNISPRLEKDLEKLKSNLFDTVTMYVSSKISDKFASELIALNAKRFIFNPGTENSKLAEKLIKSNCEVIYDCTLVMLRNGTF